jgi:hypothetical protein
LSFTRSQAAPELQVKLYKFCDFCNNFSKKWSTSIAIFSKKKKIFDFSGRFSESSNNRFHQLAIGFPQSYCF